jgi:two-component system sensor histidine kinase VicK
MVIAIDVTGLVTARMEKEQAEEKFRLLADNISQLAWMADDTGGLFWYNKRWYDYTGTTFDEMQGWGWAKVQHPDHLERVAAKWSEHFPLGKEWEDTFPIRSSNGEYRWFLSRAVPVKNTEGKTILWFGTNTDITEKLVFEQTLADKNRELSFLADSIPSIVWTSKPNGELDYINHRWHELNPSKDNEPLGNTWINDLHPDDVEHTREAWANSINTGKPYEVEFRVGNNNGNYRWYLVRALPMRDSEGRIVKWYGINTDIQEQKELQQRKDDFISIASHELKTPITTLKASLQLLHRMKDNPSEKFPRLIEQSVRSMHKVSTLIEDLLNSKRMKAAELPLNKSTFIISELLNGSCNHISLSGKHDLVILGDKQLKIYADERSLDQVVVNLVNNAVKYAPGSRDIFLIIEQAGEMAKVSVKDSGPGIEPDKLPYLFDRYYQISSAGYNSAGLGLGLYISAEIIKRHGGEMGVESELGRGSTFWFTLPLDTAFVNN